MSCSQPSNLSIECIETSVHRWGGAFSEILLDKPCALFKLDHIDGFIGYYLQGGCAVSFGDPICSKENMPELASAFAQYTKERQWNPLFILASEQFSRWANQHICEVVIEVGEELIFDPQLDPLQAKKSNKLRNKYHQALHHGLRVLEYLEEDKEVEEEFKKIGEQWALARKGHQIYLGSFNFFKHRQGMRWFYLQDGKKIIGMALLSRLDAYSGWLLKYLFVSPGSCKGSSEFLMVSILETLKKEQCKFITYGTVPVSGLKSIVGLNPVKSIAMRLIYLFVKHLFHLEQKKIYWNKFNPSIVSTYLLAGDSFGLKELYAILKVLKVEI